MDEIEKANEKSVPFRSNVNKYTYSANRVMVKKWTVIPQHHKSLSLCPLGD